MLEILKNRIDFIEACRKASRKAIEEECTVYVGYVARCDKWRVSDWFDDATVCKFDESNEIEWI